MQPWILPALLILQCWIPLAVGNSQFQDSNSLNVIRTVNVKGSRVRVFEIDGAHVAEPRVGLANSCGSIRYSNLYRKYQLSVPLKVDVSPLGSSSGHTHGVGRLVVTDLRATANKALSSKDSQVTVEASLKRSGGGQLIFLCDTFVRCQRLRDDVAGNPEEMLRAVKLVAVGRVGASAVFFRAVSSVKSPRLRCNPPGRWVVFQRRVDGSLSFAQNWDAYVKGFGSPDSNYWMGLDQLFAMTVTSDKSTYKDSSRCELRVDATDLHGKKYMGEYKLFEVLGPQQNYRLRLGGEVSGSQLVGFVKVHNTMQFSTYDRDHDKSKKSCSRLYGYGGWWYGGCHHVNLNGAYTTDRRITNSPIYCSLVNSGKHIPMKHTLMRFKCF